MNKVAGKRVMTPGRRRETERRSQFLLVMPAAVAALMGSAVGSGISYLGTQRQVEAEIGAAVDEFFRDERRDLYADLAAAADKQMFIAGRADAKAGVVQAGGSPVGWYKRFREGLAAYRNVMVQVEILGSKDVRKAAQELYEDHETLMSKVGEVTIEDPLPETEARETTLGILYQDKEWTPADLEASHNRLNEQIREDLGSVDR